MRRIVATAGLCVLLGLLTSLTVAWVGMSQFQKQKMTMVETFEQGRWRGSSMSTRLFTVLVYTSDAHEYNPGENALPISAELYRMTVPRGDYKLRRARYQRPVVLTDPPSWAPLAEIGSNEKKVIAITACGWPMRCVRDFRVKTSFGPVGYWNFETHGAIEGDDPLYATPRGEPEVPMELPYIPIVPGVLVDTLVFGVVWFALTPIGFLARRLSALWRLRKGRCPNCKYDVRQSPGTCAECGWQKGDRLPLIGRRAAPFYIIAASAITALLAAGISIIASRRFDSGVVRFAYIGDVDQLRQELDRDASQINLPHNVIFSSPYLHTDNKLHLIEAAVLGDQPKSITLLASRGADVNLRGSTGMTPMELACDWSRTDVARALLEAGALPCENDDQCSTSLAVAAATGDLELVTMLSERMENKQIYTRPVRKVVHEHSKYVKHYTGDSPFQPIIEYLVEQKLPIAAAAVSYAVEAGDAELVGYLIAQGGDVKGKADGMPLIPHAAQQLFNADIIHALLEGGADIDEPAPSGATALQLAAQQGNRDCVLLLLERGADPNAGGGRIPPALISAVDLGNPEDVGALLDAGADPTVVNQAKLQMASQEIRDLFEAARDRRNPDGATHE